MNQAILTLPRLVVISTLMMFASISNAEEIEFLGKAKFVQGSNVSARDIRIKLWKHSTDQNMNGALRVAVGDESLPLANVTYDSNKIVFDVEHSDLGTIRFSGNAEEDWISGQILHEDETIGEFTLVQTQKIADAKVQQISGRYEVENFGSVLIYPSNSTDYPLRLTLLSRSLAQPLYSIGSDFVPFIDVSESPLSLKIRFEIGVDNQVNGIRIIRGGTEHQGHRVSSKLSLDLDSFDNITRQMMPRRDVPGCTVGIVYRDQIIFLEAFGHSDVLSKTQTSTESLFQIGSLTKVLTATMLLKLEETGKLSLDDSIGKWLPKDVKFREVSERFADQLTLSRMLTHTSGLPRSVSNLKIENGVKQPYTKSELNQAIETSKLDFLPGKRWQYSNFAYAILGRVIEESTNESYEAALSRLVLTPLGMKNTFVSLSPEKIDSLASHYWVGDYPRVSRQRWDFGEVPGAGGVTSTADDLCKFLSWVMMAQESDRVLSVASKQSMLDPKVIRGRPQDLLGYAWWIDREEHAGSILSHSGEADGHSSYLGFSPDHQIGVVVLANLGGDAAPAIGKWLLRDAVNQVRQQTIANLDQAQVFFRNRDWVNTEWAYRAIVNANPDDVDAKYRLGLALFYLRRIDEAISSFEQVAKHDYASDSTHYLLARCFAVKGEQENAVRSLEKALSFGFSDFDRLSYEPELDSIRTHDRVKKYLEQFGFAKQPSK